LQNGGTRQGATGVARHPSFGFAGGRRVGARWAALTWGGLTNTGGATNPPNASDPTLDRVKADAVGCNSNASATASPCFDIGNTYQASATGTISGATVTFTGGLSPHARPFVVGQLLSCTGCPTGVGARFITALSVPPTQDTRTGDGEIGQTFTITANGSLGVSATETVSAGCSGTAGTGSNCIDIAIQLNTTGATSLDTCGENNLNGAAAELAVPIGVCQGNGVGSFVRNFRIGTNQATGNLQIGSNYDDGINYFGGSFNQNAAFTCNIVAATVVQCVKGPTWTAGVTSLGQWNSLSGGGTFVEYGDPVLGGGSRAATLTGYAGGQSFPFTPGSGYNPTSGSTTYPITGTSCGVTGGFAPVLDVTVLNGAIVDVYPSSQSQALGLGIGVPCTFTFPTAMTSGGGTGGAIGAISFNQPEAVGGYASGITDNNTMGVLMYDNSGESGMPLNSFFTNGQGGYFEPGLPVHPWGEFMGAAVSG
jgi:hypothetical protein